MKIQSTEKIGKEIQDQENILSFVPLLYIVLCLEEIYLIQDIANKCPAGEQSAL